MRISVDLLEGLAKGLREGAVTESQLKDLLKVSNTADNKFGPALVEFVVEVPKNYNHDKQIDLFAKKTKKLKTTSFFHEEFNSKNFSQATNRLVPGKSYQAKIFPIVNGKVVTSTDSLLFLKKQKAILVGGQGLALAQSQAGDRFPIDKWVVSFDEKDALWEDADGDHRVPCAHRYADGDRGFALGYFGNDWNDCRCLLCLCDL